MPSPRTNGEFTSEHHHDNSLPELTFPSVRDLWIRIEASRRPDWWIFRYRIDRPIESIDTKSVDFKLRYLYWPNVSVSFSSDSLIDNLFGGFTVPIFGSAFSNRLTFFCSDIKIGRLKNRNLKQTEKQSANTKIGTWNQPTASVGTIRRLNLYRKIDQSDISPTTPINSYTYSPKRQRKARVRPKHWIIGAVGKDSALAQTKLSLLTVLQLPSAKLGAPIKRGNKIY